MSVLITVMWRRDQEVCDGMGSTNAIDQIDSLIDDLLNDTELSASSLASMLMAVRDSVRDGYHVALARRIWNANNELKRPRLIRGNHRVDVPTMD